MLLAPFLLTLGLGAVTGSFSPTSTGIEAIPVTFMNMDTGEFGDGILDAFQQAELAELFDLSITNDLQTGLDTVRTDQSAALVLIPEGFSDDLHNESVPDPTAAPVSLVLYANPERPISVSILETILGEMLSQMQAAPLASQVIVNDLLASQLISREEVEAFIADVSRFPRAENSGEQPVRVAVYSEEAGQDSGEINQLAYLAPGMAVFFLMFTVTQGGRSVLAEREMGTFGRMLTTPVHASQVLAGKVLGIIVTGFAQVSILILASSLLFNLDWGNPAAVTALIFAVVFAATGWGILIASFVKQNWQASALGTAVMLIFGILGGTFIPVSEFSESIRWLGKITPNYWAIQGFTRLALGESLVDLLPVLIGLLLMGSGLMLISALVARKRWSDIGFSRGS